MTRLILCIEKLQIFGVVSPSRRICIYHILCGAPFERKTGMES